jgi:hypothetical protein
MLQCVDTRVHERGNVMVTVVCALQTVSLRSHTCDVAGLQPPLALIRNRSASALRSKEASKASPDLLVQTASLHSRQLDFSCDQVSCLQRPNCLRICSYPFPTSPYTSPPPPSPLHGAGLEVPVSPHRPSFHCPRSVQSTSPSSLEVLWAKASD